MDRSTYRGHNDKTQAARTKLICKYRRQSNILSKIRP